MPDAEGGGGMSVVPRTIETNLSECRRYMASVSILIWKDRDLIRQFFDFNTFFDFLEEFFELVRVEEDWEEGTEPHVSLKDVDELGEYLDKLKLLASKAVFSAIEGQGLEVYLQKLRTFRRRLEAILYT